jgi:hypothetical protein
MCQPMSKPVPTTFEGQLKELSRRVDDLGKHSHPGMVRQPVAITGLRSNTASVLAQLLDALAADGLIVDETT